MLDFILAGDHWLLTSSTRAQAALAARQCNPFGKEVRATLHGMQSLWQGGKGHPPEGAPGSIIHAQESSPAVAVAYSGTLRASS